jgi:Spy/CpxP family protein refolding chaperone
MKKLSMISLALASVLACGAALAQPGPGQRQRPDPEARLQNLAVLLELDTAQQGKVRGLFERQHQQMQARREQQRESQGEDRQARRAEHEMRREAFESELATLLTPEQMRKFQALTAERHANPPRHREADGRGPGND